jgi:hypothetical protein
LVEFYSGQKNPAHRWAGDPIPKQVHNNGPTTVDNSISKLKKALFVPHGYYFTIGKRAQAIILQLEQWFNGNAFPAIQT